MMPNDPLVRIGFDLRPALAASGGVGRYAGELARALLAVEPRAVLVLFGVALRRRPRRLWPRWVRASGAELQAARLPARGLGILARLGCTVERLCGGIDLFHATDIVYPPLRQAELVMTVHDVAFLVSDRFHGRRFVRAVTRRVREHLARAAAVIVPSSFTRQELLRLDLVDAERIVVTPLGVDHVDRDAHPPDSRTLRRRLGLERPYLICVATLEPRKNHVRLVRAFDRLVGRGVDVDLVLVGRRGWLSAEFDETLRRCRARERVHWLGLQPDAVVWSLLRDSVGLCYPSLYEGFGLPLAEALRLGIPALSSRGGALEELAGPAALLVDPTSEDALQEGLVRLVTDSDVRHRLRLAGPDRVAPLCWARTARLTAEAYRESAARRRVGLT